MEIKRANEKYFSILKAVRDFNKRKKLAELAEILGTFKDFMTQEDLERMREDRKWKKLK